MANPPHRSLPSDKSRPAVLRAATHRSSPTPPAGRARLTGQRYVLGFTWIGAFGEGCWSTARRVELGALRGPRRAIFFLPADDWIFVKENLVPARDKPAQ